MKKIAIVTDAWRPQINGVVTTLIQTVKQLEQAGNIVKLITPAKFKSIPCPTYPEIRLSLVNSREIVEELEKIGPDCIHIATEGPLGWKARNICISREFPFTTSYHTRFPEYVRMRYPVPLALSYGVLRRFHKPASRTMVATQELATELLSRGFTEIVHWSRGVDTEKFKPGPKSLLELPRPINIFVGRVAMEKNIEELLCLNLPGTTVIVGDGPARRELEQKFPQVIFAGYRTGVELVSYLQAADVFVFPSLTDTFGVVMLEAMACGVPIAAHPVTGPIDIVKNGINGYLHDDLRVAVNKALEVHSESCRNSVLKYSWRACTAQFLDNLEVSDLPFGGAGQHLRPQQA